MDFERGKFPRLARLTAVIALGALAAGASGCSNDSKDVASDTSSQAASTIIAKRLTAAQASRLAAVLFNNYEDEGAAFKATIPFGSAATFDFTGIVNWRTHSGNGVLHTNFFDSSRADTDTTIAWAPDAVYSQLAEPQGKFLWLGSRPDTTVPLHQVIALLSALASDQRDNPLLIRQSDARFEGTSNDTPEPTEILRYGTNNRYFVSTKSGRMLRIEATMRSAAAGPVVIDFTNRGPQSVRLPEASLVGWRPASQSSLSSAASVAGPQVNDATAKP